YGYPIYGSGSITNNGSLGLITLGSDINANYLVQAGFGSLLLQGSNTLSGGLVVSGGQVWARALDCLGQGPTIVSGGELQLIFGINFTGTSLSLAGGTLRGGIGGSPSYAGLVSLAADAQINVDGGSSLTFSNATGISGAAFNLTKGGGGTLVLPGANNTWASLTVSAGTVALNGTSGAGPISVLTGATLSGAGTIGGSVDVQADATLAPGASIGTLNIGGNLTLAGNLAIEVNRSVSPSNDLVNVTGTIGNSGVGVINVANLGPALQAGDKFKLFNKAVSGGATMTIAGGGTAVWSNKLEVDGSIEVVSVPLPRIVTSGVTGSDFVFSGTNGVPGGAYEVLSSTDVGLPLASWTLVNSGNFDGSGNFSVTIAINATEPQRYYLLRLP
ncbi:MAG: autotransporter-associated beta strand repeat-containing protein, partial [Verrucomicrobiota bacterium]